MAERKETIQKTAKQAAAAEVAPLRNAQEALRKDVAEISKGIADYTARLDEAEEGSKALAERIIAVEKLIQGQQTALDKIEKGLNAIQEKLRASGTEINNPNEFGAVVDFRKGQPAFVEGFYTLTEAQEIASLNEPGNLKRGKNLAFLPLLGETEAPEKKGK